MTRVPRFKAGESITESRLGKITDAIDRLNGHASSGEDDFDSTAGATRHASIKFALFQLGPLWELGEGPSASPKEPYRYPKCDGCRLVYYFHDDGVYKIKDPERDRTETVWHIAPIPHDERLEALDLATNVWPGYRYRQGDWAWCIFNAVSGRWEIFDISYGPAICTIAPSGGLPARNGRRATGVLCNLFMEVPVSPSVFDIYPVYNDDATPWQQYVFHMDPVDAVGEGKFLIVVPSRSGRLLTLWESCNAETSTWYNSSSSSS